MRDRTFALLLVVNMLWASAALAAIKKGPYLQSVTGASVMVVWETDTTTTGKVDWGTSSSYGNTATDPASGTMHAVTVNGLSPGTTYYYKVENDTTGGTFTTAPRPDQSFSFVVFGDNRTNTNDHQSVVDGIIIEAPTLVINSGDLVEYGSTSSLWQTFFDVEKELLRNACVFTAIGNHEITIDPTAQLYLKYFYLPTSTAGGEKYYSFDWGNAHFAVLDSFDGTSSFSTNQQNWLKQDLAAAQANTDIRHIFTVMHQGPYSNSTHGGNAVAKSTIVPILKQYGVEMTFAGHDHDYERGEVSGLRYMVAGGGGAPLYSPTSGPGVIYEESTLHYVLFNVDGDRVDGCAKKPDGTVMECFEWGTPPQTDAGTPDSGQDAGHDTGTPDAAHIDTGVADTGVADTGAADAATEDVPVVADASHDATHPGDAAQANDATTQEDAAIEKDAAATKDAAVAKDGSGTSKDAGPIENPSDTGEENAGDQASGCSCAMLRM